MFYKKSNDVYLVRLEEGEELIASLTEFAEERQIKGGFFHGLGGATSASLGIYRLDTDHEYHFSDFNGPLEIISLNGDIAMKEDGSVMVHCHATVSGPDLKVSGGHVKSIEIGATCEIIVNTGTGPLTRHEDEATGLKLLDFDG